MRAILFGFLLLFTFTPIAAQADPGTSPKKVKHSKSLKEGMGAVAVSVRSEIYLTGKLNVFFLREGGSIDEKKDVIRFSRKNGFMSVGNDTTDFAVKTFQLKPGRYKLVAHGVNCPKVPRPGQVCGLSVSYGGGGASQFTKPSRGYAGETPSFEVTEGQMTILGDFALISENYIRWSEIPEAEMETISEQFSALPKVADLDVPEEFVLTKKKLRRNGMFSNIGRSF